MDRLLARVTHDTRPHITWVYLCADKLEGPPQLAVPTPNTSTMTPNDVMRILCSDTMASSASLSPSRLRCQLVVAALDMQAGQVRLSVGSSSSTPSVIVPLSAASGTKAWLGASTGPCASNDNIFERHEQHTITLHAPSLWSAPLHIVFIDREQRVAWWQHMSAAFPHMEAHTQPSKQPRQRHHGNVQCVSRGPTTVRQVVENMRASAARYSPRHVAAAARNKNPREEDDHRLHEARFRVELAEDEDRDGVNTAGLRRCLELIGGRDVFDSIPESRLPRDVVLLPSDHADTPWDFRGPFGWGRAAGSSKNATSSMQLFGSSELSLRLGPDAGRREWDALGMALRRLSRLRVARVSHDGVESKDYTDAIRNFVDTRAFMSDDVRELEAMYKDVVSGLAHDMKRVHKKIAQLQVGDSLQM